MTFPVLVNGRTTAIGIDLTRDRRTEIDVVVVLAHEDGHRAP
jgi:hypothetical protein